MSEEEPKTEYASEENGNSQPRAVQKFVQCAAVSGDDAFDEIASPFLHPRAFMPGFALAENARAHQRSKRKRNQTRGENRDNDSHGEFAEDAAEQAGQEDKRDENGGERERHRQDGERNFAGSIVSGLYNRFAV